MKIDELVEHALDGNAVLFVGSGFSRSALNICGRGPRTGGELAELLSQECGLSSAASLDDAADLYVHKRGAMSLVTLLRNEYQIAKLTPEQQLFGSVPWRRVYTTNYDDAIELAYKQNNRPVVPISLAEKLRRVSEEATQCVHINGFIDDLSEDTLLTSFKLTDTSYSSDSFAASPWAGQFRHDISASYAVLFVGYSAYDLDIKRILLESTAVREKCVFVVGMDPNELVRFKLSKFGDVSLDDTSSVADRIDSIRRTYSPRTQSRLTGRFVIPLQPPAIPQRVRDLDVQELFLWGRLKRDLVWSSATGATIDPYVCIRDRAYACLEMLVEGDKNIVVRGDMGSGKSVFLETVGALASQFGFEPHLLETPGVDALVEIETVSRSPQRTLLLVDGYTNKGDEIETIARYRTDGVHVVFSARSLKHDVSYDWLYSKLGVDAMPELDLDYLTETECNWFRDSMDVYGLWGERAEFSKERKADILQGSCQSRLSSILLEILQSPSMKARLRETVQGIIAGGKEHIEAVASVLILSVLDISVTMMVLSNLIGTEVLNQAGFRNNMAVKELFDFTHGRVRIRNSIVSRHVVSESIDPSVTVSALTRLATKADLLSADPAYYSILRDLVRFSNVQSVLPTTGRMNAALLYYESLKRLGGCKRNPHYWLQYAIASLALGKFADAHFKLETAYAHAKARPGYDTYMLDNSAARLRLEELIAEPATDRDVAMGSFRKARAVLSRQVGDKEHRYYPYRVAAKYAPFLSAHLSILLAEDVAEVVRAARFMLRRVDNLPGHRVSNRHVVDCRMAMEAIITEHGE